jgi:LPS export ABC transporter protein LptC
MRVAVVATLIFLLFNFFGCAEKIKPSVLATQDSQTLPQQESWNSTITVSDSGRVTAIIIAGNVRVYEMSQITQLSQGMRVLFFNPQGIQTSVLTSEEGSVDEITNNLEARKNVHVVSSDSSHMKTEQLYWDNARQLIHTPDYVEITTETDKLQGHGFESDQSLKHYRIFKVTGESRAQ